MKLSFNKKNKLSWVYDNKIVNATIVNENSTICGDILIKNGWIEQINSQVKGQENETIYDAKGNLLLPGMIEQYVHFREPGIENMGTIKTESQQRFLVV